MSVTRTVPEGRAAAGCRPFAGLWRAWPGLLALALLLACAGPGGEERSDPVFRLVSQGFRLEADRRDAGGPAVLRYAGAPASTIVCRDRSGAEVPSQSVTLRGPNYTARQSGQVRSYLIVPPDGAVRGLYVNVIDRTVTGSDGRVLAREIEKVEFRPGGSGQFRNGVTCRANI